MITLTAIEQLMYHDFAIKKPLIVAPLRVANNTWPNEIQKWDHLRSMTWSVITGTAQQRVAALMKDADIYIINRENVQWLIEKSGFPFDFDMLVIDELSSFKSWQAKRFKSLMKVRPFVKRVVGLTGTPSSNMDSWICLQSISCWTWASDWGDSSHSTGKISFSLTNAALTACTRGSQSPARSQRSTGASEISPSA